MTTINLNGAAPSVDESHVEETGHAPLLEVRDLSVTFHTPRGSVRAVRHASFTVHRGEVLGLVGESGCGKSTVAFATMRYLPTTAEVGGEIRFEGRDLNSMSSAELQSIRGDRIAMVYQDPGSALNPSIRVGLQIEEVLHAHRSMSRQEAQERVAELFESVGLPNPARIGQRYPHELSGGQQQRVVIAMALACEPDLLLMDEPTTGLDVTTEATILDLISELKDRVNAGIIFVSHNLGVIARVADRVAVMYAGQVIEEAPVRDLFSNPSHPYTAGLLSCVPAPVTGDGAVPLLRNIPGSVYPASAPNVDACLFADRCPIVQDICREQAPPEIVGASEGHPARCFFPERVNASIWGDPEPRRRRRREVGGTPLLSVDALHQYYGTDRKKFIFFGPPARRPVRANVDVDFEIGAGRTLGIVGESGSGKSTAARSIAGLERRTSGEVLLEGEPLARDVADRTDDQRAKIRMVFQNPAASLNPQLPIGHALVRSIRQARGLGRREARRNARALLDAVGLGGEYMERRPRELSGGQQQRVALAAAFAADPDLVIADEAVSALDVSVQAQVLNLITARQQREGTAFMFITHDLGVVRYISDDILVMYGGYVVETGPAETVLAPPWSPYTEALLSAAPIPDPDAEPSRIRLEGAVPTLRQPFKGCPFADRCPRNLGDLCDNTPPPMRVDPANEHHKILCHIPLEELAIEQRKAIETREKLVRR
ncbi:MAG: ABC transporter ATP-binding protein [Chloroflexi bacterium]|nr:ABC transporter ATP-binding protein [Chloroflexota bacterium]